MADSGQLLTQKTVIKLELFVGGEESDLGDDEEFEYERFPDLGHQPRLILKHALGYLAEKVGFLSQNGPVFLTEPNELLVLNLVVLDGMMKLAFCRVLKRCLLLCILYHDQALANPIELVL